MFSRILQQRITNDRYGHEAPGFPATVGSFRVDERVISILIGVFKPPYRYPNDEYIMESLNVSMERVEYWWKPFPIPNKKSSFLKRMGIRKSYLFYLFILVQYQQKIQT